MASGGKLMRDAKVIQIYEDSAQIMRRIIAPYMQDKAVS
jgi:alkylation response protein AidB-like acyl-CoA dehydrogenase